MKRSSTKSWPYSSLDPQQALALTEALGMRPLQAHCHHGLGTRYAKAGQQEKARAALSTAIAK